MNLCLDFTIVAVLPRMLQGSLLSSGTQRIILKQALCIVPDHVHRGDQNVIHRYVTFTIYSESVSLTFSGKFYYPTHGCMGSTLGSWSTIIKVHSPYVSNIVLTKTATASPQLSCVSKNSISALGFLHLFLHPGRQHRPFRHRTLL